MKQTLARLAIVFKCAYCGEVNWVEDSLTYEKNQGYRSDGIMCDECHEDNFVVDED